MTKKVGKISCMWEKRILRLFYVVYGKSSNLKKERLKCSECRFWKCIIKEHEAKRMILIVAMCSKEEGKSMQREVLMDKLTRSHWGCNFASLLQLSKNWCKCSWIQQLD